VRVNDRGPFHGGRLIDVTKAAAASLGLVDSGTAPRPTLDIVWMATSYELSSA
jgi:rare lipoprotein A